MAEQWDEGLCAGDGAEEVGIEDLLVFLTWADVRHVGDAGVVDKLEACC